MSSTTAAKKAKRFYSVIAVLLSIASLSLGIATAEPWIANRFAQNCAACHAPGRVNKSAKGRRCTLSCQGCHVNPQGGGLRNQYGKWNSQRWLRSIQSDYLHDEKTPAPFTKQPYAKRVMHLEKGKKLPKKALNAPGHRVIKATHPDMKYYDKYSWTGWNYNVAVDDEQQFMAHIPENDPYRIERTISTYAGADLRYFYGNYKYDASGTTIQEGDINGFMAVDVGFRARPIKWHKLSFVVESRFQNDAQSYALNSIDNTRGSGYLRSAYVLVDDLAYNSFFQFGNYRPLFGNMNVSHVSLAQEMTGFGGRPTFRTLSVGTAPNIPFLIVNMIMPSGAFGTSSDTQVGNDDEGLLVTFGGRWVTYGLSTKFSYWSTTRDGTNGESKKWDMYSFTAGGMVGPIILNLEATRIERDQLATSGSDAGNVNTLEAKYRAWKELYLTSSYALSNTTSTLAEGEATEISYGVKFFPVAGLETEVGVVSREDKAKSGTTTNFDFSYMQLHTYF